MQLLYGKTTMITGAGRGIGRATAELFAHNGAIVYANDVETGSLDDLACDNLFPVYFDVTDSQAVKAVIMQIKKEQGQLDCLINNAGIMQDALIGMVDINVARKIFDVNVFAMMDLMQLATRLMKKQEFGSIINFTSIVGVHGNAGQLAYSASKGAVIAMTKTAAKELAPFKIRVNAVAPGMIDTDLFRSIGEERITARISQIGMGRLGTPNDIAKTCMFLASDLSDYITGQVIGIDGSTIL
jgi:3-oxoacyl-[acyl-carrier protein] reductase